LHLSEFVALTFVFQDLFDRVFDRLDIDVRISQNCPEAQQ
jgi:hypothetical protein